MSEAATALRMTLACRRQSGFTQSDFTLYLFGRETGWSPPIIHTPSAPSGIPTDIRVGSTAVPRIEAGIPRIKVDAGRDRGSIERLRQPQ